MTERLSRDPTQAEFDEAQTIARMMADIVPPQTTIGLRIGSLSLLLVAMFRTMVKDEYRLKAFDEMCAHVRLQLIEAGGSS